MLKHVSLILCFLMCCPIVVERNVEAKNPRLLHFLGSVLLMGYAQDSTLFVTQQGHEIQLDPPGIQRGGHHTYASLSRDGTIVATSYTRTRDPYHEGIAIYSLREGKWKVYGDFYTVWAVAISPDASKLAIVAEDSRESGRKIFLLDLDVGRAEVLTKGLSVLSPPTWSPDSRYIAYEDESYTWNGNSSLRNAEIKIVELATKHTRLLVAGSFPSWAPSGEWIAYLDDNWTPNVVRPDGTGIRKLAGPQRHFPWVWETSFFGPIVWSPDSENLVVHEPASDETARVSVYLLNLRAGKLQRKTGKGMSLLGWAKHD